MPVRCDYSSAIHSGRKNERKTQRQTGGRLQNNDIYSGAARNYADIITTEQ
ncbi:hypothetical protein GCM10007391_17190 [Alteromonas halophila]|uniref:Uncharacterized protein n=1 Tax=Alteromonas halophila TaxID=516698 RepID=A0A918JJB0_9ALTE|nr:hypothetical protein GCM10007391_17190 [Alteromonas halophila]